MIDLFYPPKPPKPEGARVVRNLSDEPVSDEAKLRRNRSWYQRNKERLRAEERERYANRA